MSRSRLRLLLCLAVALSGCGGAKKGPGAFTPPPTSVEVARATTGAVRESLKALGTVEATESVKVSTEIDALVLELPFREGAAVTQGQLLARLDDSQLAAELQRAEALRDQARLRFNRLKELSERNVSSSQDRDDAEAVLKVADANVVVARARLTKTRLLAPFAGVVGRRLVSPGAFLRSGDGVVELARVDEVKVSFSIPERHLPSMRRGAGVEVTTVASPGRTFAGTVSVVEPMLDAATRTGRVVALVPNKDGVLSPGMSAEVSAVLGERPQAITVPDEAVFAEGDKTYVYAVTGGDTVTRRAVELGARQTGSVEIIRGLAAGDTVVRAGHQKLYEGAKVAPVSEAPAK